MTPKPTSELIAQFIVDHNKQRASPLFDRVPPEVRNSIFLYALLSYEDLGSVYPDDVHYSRPEYRHTMRIDPRLLETCRLVYIETRFLPVMAYEHTFWCYRAPPGITFAEEPEEYFKRFTEEQKDHIHRVHFFTQQFYLESDFVSVCMQPDFRPQSLKITLRHGDWWYWEDNEELFLKDGWASGLCHSQRLREVILELETMERDKEQIYAIADRVSKETYALPDGRMLSTAGNPLIKRDWMGPSRLEDLRYDKEQDMWVDRDGEAERGIPDPGLKYCIVEIRWTAVTYSKDLK